MAGAGSSIIRPDRNFAQRIVLDTDLLDYHCTDNEKSAPHMVGK